ncbi:MAG: DUF2970 domain-containing protein [Gammaproteobacteria bacterium]
MTNDNSGKTAKPSLVSVFGSVLASMFGVQSSRKHAQDFTAGRPWVYVVVGLVVTVAFVLTVWLAVKLVLKSAGV